MLADAMRRGGRWLMADPRRRWVYDALNAAAQAGLGTTIKTGPARGMRFRGGDTAGYILGLSEPSVQRALVSHLRPRDVYFDVGTHAGFHALLGSRIVGSKGRVDCFEPVPANIDILAHNLATNGIRNAWIHQLALGDHDGTATMDLRANITARLSDNGAHVQIARLDSVPSLPNPHLVKIDVEGAEAQVLDGARGTLERARPVLVIEIHGDQEQPVRTILQDIGYLDVQEVFDGGMPHLIAVPER